MISRALHMNVFDQPAKNQFINQLLIINSHVSSDTGE
jgi:hypothetical protein